MELKLKYVNKIKYAYIKLNGLTVIVGPNSSGKSTVGRTLFSVVKAIANTESIKEESNNEDLLRKHTDSFYSRLRGMRRKTNRNNIYDEIPHTGFDFIQQLRESSDQDQFLSSIAEAISKQDFVPRQKKLLTEDLENIRICWNYKEEPAANLKTELQYLIESEFMNTFCSMDSEETIVELKSEGRQRVQFHAQDNSVKRVTLNSTSFVNDATYIESPLYIHLVDAITRAKTWREIEGRASFLNMTIVPSHIKDMVEKIVWSARKPIDYSTSSMDVNKITGGKLTYDSSTHQIIYQEGKNFYTTINVASGIKSLSIIQLLESAKVIGPNRLLIWDEPENHLHPEWQIVFAEKLVKLAKDGVPILVTTHSPYFLQAIRYYSAREEMGKYINYYTPEEDYDHLTTMVDVTRDLTPVFAKLAQPMNQIMDIVDYK